MNVRRGDVAILYCPYSDASGFKVRPALVVHNRRIDHEEHPEFDELTGTTID